uniref:SH3 domain-containing protein n=1 Tax=Anaerococcus mediterraneensis TaxID=1870984 RepID=UPI0009309591|nr:SH3 domain-containing protein [Anaerococcus mediterraneensis]
MICKKCGSENEDFRKVCKSCGADLVEAKENEKPRSDRKTRVDDKKIGMKNINTSRNRDRKKRKYDMDFITVATILGAMLILALLAIIISYFMSLGKGKSPSENKDTPSQVEETVESKEELYKKAIEAGKENIKNKEYEKAIKVLDAVPESSGKYYKQAQDMIGKIEDDLAERLKSRLENKEYQKVSEVSAAILRILPESEKIKDLKDQADKKIEEEKPAENTENQEENTENTENTENSEGKNTNSGERVKLSVQEKEALRISNAYGQNGNPKYTDVYKESDFLNKKVKINASMGEIRTEPNLNSGVAGYVNDGDSLEVSEVVNDGGRYWLKIEGGWISSKLVTGEFR